MSDLLSKSSERPLPVVACALTGQTDPQQLLDLALQRQSLEEVQQALAGGADPNAYVRGESVLGRHEGAVALLSEYEHPTWLAILEALLCSGADPNLPTDQRAGGRVLHFMSQHAHLRAMRLLLDHGADPNSLDEGTALDWLILDYSFEETCQLAPWYQRRVLREIDAPADVDEDRETTARWLVARHQLGWAMLRKAGGLLEWELRQGPVKEVLQLRPEVAGGLYTSHARPEAGFLQALGEDVNERLARWVRVYADPDVFGYEAQAVKNFDYAGHLAEGMAIGKAMAPYVPEGVEFEILVPTAESIAAMSTEVDVHTWRPQGHWDKTVDWRDRLSADWFGPEPVLSSTS